MHTRIAPIGEYKVKHITATGTVVPVGACVSTTSATTITAGSNVVVTPVSMANIVTGMYLNIANGTGTAEDIQVLSTTATTYTANYLYNHSGAYTVTSRTGTYLGPVVVNAVGTGVTLTLYDGSPNLFPDAGTALAIITVAAGTYNFAARCDKGLFYTVAGTPGDYSLHYLDYAAGGQ